MPRQARLDAPATLHHVMVRGIERGKVFRDRKDRERFLGRLGEVAAATQTSIYAWALLPNHAHLLARSGPRGLAPFMRRLLTGYAIEFNRRHHRYGHLFQNRYKSIVCEEDTHFRELVGYIHLNPLRANLVADVRALERYPWCGHAGVLGHAAQPWHDRRYVLAWFGRGEAGARRAYRRYVAEGVSRGRRPDLVGGGLIRSLGGWAEVRAMRRRKARTLADERILGSTAFVERMIREADERFREQHLTGRRLDTAGEVIRRLCEREQVSATELRLGGRRRSVTRARTRLAVELVGRLGLSLAEAARHLGVSTSGISKALTKASNINST